MRRLVFIVAVLAGLLVAAPAALAAPTGVTGMAGDARVELAWQPEAGATGYRVFRGTTPTAVTTPLMASPMTPPGPGVPASFTDLTAANGTTYYYAVRSTVGGVESGNSALVQATPRARSCSGPNPVVQENCFPGNPDWDTDLATGMDGFATASSINKGGSVGLKLQAGTGATVDIEVFRSGYYGGAGARLFSTLLAVPVGTQPGCVSTTSVGLLDCANWAVNATLTTTASWPSGMYLLRVTRRDTLRNTHIPLVVRDDGRGAQILYGIPDTTYQAYNYWGGKSLYDDKSTGATTVAGTARAVKVSFDRPYQAPHDEILRDWYTRADYPTVSWLEKAGYDVSYTAASDLERSGASVRDHRIYISGAHDEYWSAAMRTALEQARDAGVDLFFTGANELYWKVRFEPSPVSSVQDRVLVNYKSTQSGPADPSGIPTGTWRDPAGANQPENALTGIQYIGQRNFEYFPLRVPSAQGKDRIWRYTGLDTQATGATATVGTALVGWEWDARTDNGREPPGVTTLSSSPVNGDLLQDAGRTYAPGSATSHMVKHQRTSGSLIVSTGTNHWNWGLARNALAEGEPDRRIRQATTNILFDMGAFPETPESDIVLDDPSSPPLVTLRVPSANATNVATDTVVRAGFSRPMDPASITTTSFSLRRPDGTAVPATVTYDDVAFTATLTPTSPLALETTYTARLEPTVRAANGIAIAGTQTWSFTTRPPDRTPPTVSITAPANNSTVVASTTVTANAADETAVAGVQFKLDGANLGAEDTTAPYSVPWDASGVSAGGHTLTAVARDTSNNSTISAAVNVTVDPTGMVLALGFEESTGTAAADSSGKSNPGTLAGPAHTDAGRFGRALSFDGVNDWVTVADAATLDLTNAMTLEAWVSPVTSTSWRTVLMKEQPGGLVYGLYGSNNTNTPSVHIFNAVEHDTRGTAALPANAWSHLAATFDGTTVRLYVNGTQVATGNFPGNLLTSSGALHIGGNAIWGEYFSGKIDEVRVYRRVLSAAEIQTDMNRSVVPQDTVLPTAPTGLAATGEVGRAQLSWTAATDNTGVVRYNVHRGTAAGFTPTAANRVAQPTGTSYTDSGLAAGTYYYRVTAEDGAGNVGPASNEASATVAADTAPPTVSVTAPAAGATVVGTINLTANAADNSAVASVQFKVDGTNVGAADTSSPYSASWDSRALANGPHSITAVATDGAGNATTSAAVSVNVDNPPVDATGLVAAYGFEEQTGTALTDSSTQSNHGTLGTGARTTSGRFGEALTFGGNASSSVPDSNSLDLATAMTIEAWVNPTTAVNAWRPAVLKERALGLDYALYESTGGGPPSGHVFTTAEDDVRGTAALPANTWSHLATTWDGATLRLYVNGTQVASKAVPGTIAASTGPLTIGGSTALQEFFNGRVDEVRVYNRALTAGELATDMNTPVVPAVVDSQAPTAPTNLTATGSIGQAQLSWTAATDNIGVARYNVHRGTTAGFTPTTANRIAQPTGTSYTDSGLAAGTYYYRVTAADAAGNVGPASNEANATATADTTAPTVSITAPTGGTVTNTITVSSTASDNVGVAGVQFTLDGANLASEDTTAPYSITWDTRSVPNGTHTLRARARDAAGNATTSAAVDVTVDNPPVDTSGLVGAWGFEEASGTAVSDSSSQGNHGTLNATATRTTAGRFGSAVQFNGTSSEVVIPDANSLDLATGMTLEAWLSPTGTQSGWRSALVKEQTGGLSYGLYANTNNNRPSANINTGGEDDVRGTTALAGATWTHVAATYDGATLRFFVNGTQVSSKAIAGSLVTTTGALRMGGNAFAGEHFDGKIDEVRIYNRPLTAAEITTDMGRAVVPAVTDSIPPTAPTNLTATGALGRANLSWTAATDNTAVARYNVHRGTTAGFTPATANRIAQPTSTSYVDTAPAGTYFYKVTAEDGAGNVGPASNEASAVVTADTTAPTVSLTAPTDGATVSGTVSVTASAGDDVAVAGVQFKLDGANLGAEDTSAPYSFNWDSVSATEGPHTLTAVARDGAGNQRTSAPVAVTVTHPPVDTTGLVAAYGFEEGTGATVDDRTSSANDGTINGAAWNDGGRFGKALSFDGINDRIDIPDSATLDLSTEMTLEAWVKPNQHNGWRTVVLKEGGGGQVYGMYSSAWGDHPSGHVNPGTEQWTQAPASLPVNSWSHLALTYDGATARLYVDGAQVSQAPISGGPIQASTGALRIGGNAPWGEYFQGLIDEVRIYRRVLTAAEITADMTKPVVTDAPPAPGPERFGQFSPPQTWPLVPVHIATLSNGKIVVWDGFDAALNSERIWDPTTNTFDPIPTGRNLFCAGHVTLPDGRLFIAGGHIAANEGTKDTSIFNPQTRSWFFGQDMARARWYPTVTTLPDGRILVVSGDNITLNAPGMDVPLKNGSETLPEIYDVANNTWTPLNAAQRRMPLYPFMFVLPDGKVFDAGPDRTTRTLDTTTGQWTTVGQSPIDGHSAVMYRPGKILKSGTWADPDYPGIVSTNRAATIDFNVANPQWTEVAPMNHGRSYHTLTVLPDGKVFASGGMSETDGIDHSKAVFETEIWDPDANTWTATASHARPREYHSSAVLLQDGRVLLAGGGAFAAAQNESNAEIYSPPYLFKGPRPTITSAPTTLQLGQTFTVNTPDAARIQKMALVRMGSVTHNFDMDQRFMNLSMTQAGANAVSVDAPTNRNVAIPGWYYLFALDGNGVPSVGWIVKVEPNSGDTQAPTAPATLTATANDDDVALSWSAATDNAGVTEYRVHRSTTAGFTPSAANRIATVTSGTSYSDQNLAAGTYRYRVVAVDAAGNASPSSPEASATVAADATAPTVSITAPAAGATVGATINVAANATDNRGVASVQFRLDGADLGAADTSAPYSVSWDTRTATNGAHNLTAVARDAAGNATTSAQVGVTVDNGSPPTVSITAPAGGATVTGDVNLTASAADDRGVAGVQFKVDGANIGAEDTTAPYQVTWNSRTVANGPRRLTAVARDSDGNTTTSANVDVNVSNVQTGLVAAYGFEEASGTTVTDDSGSGRDGTISGATRSTAGRFGSALTFDGINDWVTIPDANSLDLTTAMTLEAYVRPSAISSWRTVLMKEQPGGLVYGLYANSNTNRPSAHINTGTEDDTRGTAQLALNAWTHLAMTYDGATLRMFVNGVQASSKAHTGPVVVSTGALRIGGNGVWPEWFAGLIDEVRVYGRVLTAAEIQSDMNLAVKPPTP